MNYGISYMGSKSKIAKTVCGMFPKADHFYDLFGGGFSITHCMMLHRSKDYKEFHFNEIRSGVCEIIQDSIAGKYSYENFKPKWISREEFMAKKDSDAYIKMIWSFGNNWRSYLFGPDIENEKRSLHQAVIFNEFDEFAKKTLGMDRFADGLSIIDKRLFLKSKIKNIQLEQLQQLERLQQLEQLQRLERLEQLQRLERLQQLRNVVQRVSFTNLSYEHVPIKPNSIIYCDIPYKGTTDYGSKFNHDKFYEWAVNQKESVFVSEYTCDHPGMKCITNKKKHSLLVAKHTRDVKIEKIFVNPAAYRLLMTRSHSNPLSDVSRIR